MYDEMKRREVKDWNITAEELKHRIEEFSDGSFFDYAQYSVLKSVLLYYVNSGYLRFDQYKEYDANSIGTSVDDKCIAKEVERECFSEKELYECLERFFAAHSYSKGDRLSCGSCGIQMLTSKFIQFHTKLLSELGLLRYLEEEERCQRKFELDPTNIVEIPINAEWETEEVNMAKA